MNYSGAEDDSRRCVRAVLYQLIRGRRECVRDQSMLTERLHRHADGRRALSDGVPSDCKGTDRHDDRRHIGTVKGCRSSQTCEKKYARRGKRL